MRVSDRAISIIGGLVLLCLFFGAAYVFLNTQLTRGLGEEKSYFHHAGTYYQLRPELRGQKWNLETWDDAEAIASAVRSHGSPGVRASWSDQLSYLPPALRLDRSKRAMCVIRINESVYVVRGVKKRVAKCEAVQPGFAVSNVRSGELVPSSDKVAEIYYELTK